MNYLCLVERYSTFRCQIGFVAHQQLVHVLRGVSVTWEIDVKSAETSASSALQAPIVSEIVEWSLPINFVKPLFDVDETLEISSIIDYDDAMSTSIIAWCDSAKSFLAGGIPLVFKISSLIRLKSWHVIIVALRLTDFRLTIWSFIVFASRSIVRIF